MATFTKRGVIIDSMWSRNRREGYYCGKGAQPRPRTHPGPQFFRGASRIDSLCKLKTSGG